jgi:hypothetical protein
LTADPSSDHRHPRQPSPAKKEAADAMYIPLAYRLLFLYIDPVAALFGAYLLMRDPARFLATMSPAAALAASNKVVYDQLAATYVLLAWTEGVVLRIAGTPRASGVTMRVWKGVLAGALVCDIMHLWGSWAALGGEVFWNPIRWRGEDWGNLGFLWIIAAARLGFLLGAGFGSRRT